MHRSWHGHAQACGHNVILYIVSLFLASASDYSLSATTITITATGANVITLTSVPDEILEGNEIIVIEVASPPSGDYPGVTFPEPVTITIDDAEGTYWRVSGETIIIIISEQGNNPLYNSNEPASDNDTL